jgi:GrpB-like predicted nucleotidyltransferase (UPF0157 family)
MPAKPIIDILAGVGSIELADSLLDQLLQNGYTTSREFNAMLRDRKWLMRVENGRRTHHLHVVQFEGEQWRDRLRFRDVLRTSPPVAAAYIQLKEHLAARHRADREAYTEAKAQFVRSVLLNGRS